MVGAPTGIVGLLCQVLFSAIKKYLKVVGNEKNGGSRRSQMLGNGLGPWRSRFIHSLNMQFLFNNLISFSACNSEINRRLL